MTFSRYTVAMLLALGAVCTAQHYSTTPVPILKQINRHNDDGSYSYGYEGGDGSFKIETKYPTGEVFGKYGYVDDQGKTREIEYGASRRGFEPQGTDITVPPPTISRNNVEYSNEGDYDDGQYREDPDIYNSYTNAYKGGRASSSGSNSGLLSNFNLPSSNRAAPQQTYQQPAYQAPQQSYQPQPAYHAPPQAPRAAPLKPAVRQPHSTHFAGHPASHFNVETGSYSVNYSG